MEGINELNNLARIRNTSLVHEVGQAYLDQVLRKEGVEVPKS